MRIAITGASGTIGSATLRRLGIEGGHQLVGIARRVPETRPDGADVEWVSADLTRDACIGTLERAFKDADAVVHLAWGFQPSHDLEELGVGGTRRVLEAVSTSGVPHLVHMSSVGAYSPKHDDTPVDESWPTGGVSTSRYSVHKAAAERLLDVHERAGEGTLISRIRPGIVGQRSAGSALLRYGLPAVIPAAVLDHIWILPMDRRLAVPLVHADDVADAIARELERKVGGAFNLAADPPITTEAIAAALGARPVHVPSSVVRVVASATWHARLQQVDTGWLDLGFAVPLVDSSRALRELDWLPSLDGVTVLHESARGYASRCRRRHAGASTPQRRQGAARLRHPGPGRSAGPALRPR